MYRKSVNVNTMLMVVVCLILSAILFQMSMGTTAYGSMSVTGVVLGSASKYSHFRSAFLSMGI